MNFLRTVVFLAVILFPIFATHGASTEISATVKITVCGDGTVETPEQCDGSNLNGVLCSSLGFMGGGTLSCLPACEFNTSQCVAGSSGGSGGGGGWGGGAVSMPVGANTVFKGRAYPGSTVTLLKDAQVAATTVAGPDAQFEISLSGLGGNSYMFSVYSEDTRGMRSPLQNFPIVLTAGVTTNVTGIFIAPTIAVDKSEVRRGDNIAIFGQTAPSSEVTISVNSEEEFFVKRLADATGAYLFNFDTSILEIGQHQTKSKAALSGEITAFGKVVGFTVGTKNIAATLPSVSRKGDLNKDGRVNLVDFSIAAYWYKRALNATSQLMEAEGLNGDGKINLADFSIMAFHWTG